MGVYEKINILKDAIIDEGFNAVMSVYDLGGMERMPYDVIWHDKESGIMCSSYVDIKDGNLIRIYVQLYVDVEKDLHPFRDVLFFSRPLRVGSIYDYVDDEDRDIFVKNNILQLCTALNVVCANFNVDAK